MSDINLRIGKSLEIDYYKEELNSDTVSISSSKSYNEYESQTRKYIFEPQETGEYKLEYDGSVLTVNVSDIPDSVVEESNLIDWYPMENGAQDETAGNSTYGDTTDYSGTVNGATEMDSGGVADILTDSIDSGVFYFDGDDNHVREAG